jgi:uncharacterized protein (DUF58 family)
VPQTTLNYLDPATLAAIGSLELRARLIVEGLMTGMHRSPYQGFSIEFAQHRAYTPGDDIRHLDWKVFGRTDKLYLKQYQKETNLDFIVLVDSSGSMSYSGGMVGKDSPAGAGGRSAAKAIRWRKYDHAASIAAAMCYLALRQQDRVGLVLFGDRMRAATRMSNSHDHWRSVAEALSAEPVDDPATLAAALRGGHGKDVAVRRTDLARLFDEVLGKLRQRSLMVLISDLFDDPANLERGLARLNHQRHDLIVMQTLDAAELQFPFRSSSEFVGLEGEGRVGLDPAALRKEYLAALKQHIERCEQITRRFQFDHVLVNTSEPLGAPLSHFLARRSAMMARGR